MKKILIILTIILFFLIITIYFINQFSKQNNTTSLPNKYLTTSEKITASINNSSNQNTLQLNTLKVIPIFNSLSLDQAKLSLPYENNDVKIVYSPLLNKYFVNLKTTSGQQKFDEWVKSNDLTDIVKTNNLFIFTDKDSEILKNEVENKYIEYKYDQISEQLTSPTTSPTNYQNQQSDSFTPNEVSPGRDEVGLLTDLLKILLNPNINTSIPNNQYPISNISPSNVSPTPFVQQTSSVPLSLPLYALFQEINQKVGVPAKILEGVMMIESPSTLNLSADDIGRFSEPGKTMTNCRPNVCSATGPMQMTIGVDGNGGTCTQCGLDYCPNAWSNYGQSVNRYGNYTHTSNPCNIRDNVYAAAAKLKNDSQAVSATDWNQSEVYRAATRYYGSCSDKYRYARLNNMTYCEYLWWYYKK